jgi:hypothetical protein
VKEDEIENRKGCVGEGYVGWERMRERYLVRVRVRIYGSDVVVSCVFVRMVNGFFSILIELPTCFPKGFVTKF